MWMSSLALYITCVLNVMSLICGYEQGYYDHLERKEPVSDQPSGLESVSSLEELLELLSPAYGLLQHCLRRRALSSSSAHHDDDLWGNPRKVPLYKTDETFEIILEEIQRTICRPREVCLEVSKEYPENTNNFYLPRCVSVHRCGGCCNNEAMYCSNTSHSFIDKTLVELSSSRMERSVVMVTFVNHTACECLPKIPLHSIIRRDVASHSLQCSSPDVPCAAGHVWNPPTCACVPAFGSHTSTPGLAFPETTDAALLALCGPNKVLDEDECECVCENGLTQESCGPGWRLDETLCECLCEGEPSPSTCPPNQLWDSELCGCVCQAQCPQSQPLNPETCSCQCRENQQSCLLQGKKFNPSTCSCYRLPCRTPPKKCPSGSFYSHSICHCVPNYMRSGKWN